MNIEVGLTIKTCPCGSMYAVPHWVTAYQCPMCAYRKWESLEKRYEVGEDRITHLERVIIGLRGAIKQRKGRP